MNNVSIDLAAGTAKLGAGVLTGEALVAAEKAHAHVMTGICNTVGLVAALLGGGMGNQISLYGLGVDSMLSARLVTASGDVVTASATENEELWWGLRGAGTNFGIVSELTVKAYPEVNKGVHWTGTLGWPGSKENCAKVMESIRSMGVGKGAGVTVLFARVPEMGVRSPLYLLISSFLPRVSHALLQPKELTSLPSPRYSPTSGSRAQLKRREKSTSPSSISAPPSKSAPRRPIPKPTTRTMRPARREEGNPCSAWG